MFSVISTSCQCPFCICVSFKLNQRNSLRGEKKPKQNKFSLLDSRKQWIHQRAMSYPVFMTIYEFVHWYQQSILSLLCNTSDFVLWSMPERAQLTRCVHVFNLYGVCAPMKTFISIFNKSIWYMIFWFPYATISYTQKFLFIQLINNWAWLSVVYFSFCFWSIIYIFDGHNGT